jgi:Fic family protein
LVSGQPNWAPGSGDYVKRSKRRSLRASTAQDTSAPSRASWTTEDRWRFEDTGVTWEPFEVEKIEPSSVARSRHRFRAHLPELIWNTAALEGNNFTLPEVKTLLEGVTVGGKKLEDEQQIIALSDAYNQLDEMVGAGRYELNKEVSDELHRLVARHEAIEAGSFRGEGKVQGGGTVQLASGGVVPGTEHGEGGALLREHFTNLVDYLKTVSDPRHRALIYFASATRRQFYFDGNKRTARLMMAGELMSCGYDIVSVPYSRKLEFNNALDVLFDLDDATELLRFLSTCTLTD